MKLLKISVAGLPLFDGKCEVDFLASQRVSCENAEKMKCLFKNTAQDFYQNNAISFVGINASGKTTVLKLIIFVCRLLNNESINNIPYSEIFDGLNEGDIVNFDTYFYTENNLINLLHTEISKINDRFYIKDEFLKSKPVSKVKSKTELLYFDLYKVDMKRNNDEEFLLDDVSISVAFNKRYKSRINLADMLYQTNVNKLCISEDCPAELIAFFDPSIKYLHIQKNGKEADIHLCFKGKNEIVLSKISDLDRYLSSGTIKGINIFMSAMKAFETGGYLVVDELENHFNYEIVAELIRFFMDKQINPHGAVLVFSTHYSELLDEFDRNDNIYVIRNKSGISVQKLSSILKRADIKKSEAFQSDLLDGTAPSYDAYMLFKKSLIKARKEDA